MSAIPYAIVRARRTTGLLLLLVSIVTTVAVALAVGSYLVAPRTVQPVAAPTGGTATGSPQQAGTGGLAAAAPLTAAQQLASLRSSDAAAVATVPDSYWVVQLASNHVGPDKSGSVWTEESILADHQALRNTYGGVLLSSNDFATYSHPDYWVTVLPSQVSSSPEPLIAWCGAQGIDRDHCGAKRLSRTLPYTGDNTKWQK